MPAFLIGLSFVCFCAIGGIVIAAKGAFPEKYGIWITLLLLSTAGLIANLILPLYVDGATRKKPKKTLPSKRSLIAKEKAIMESRKELARYLGVNGVD